MSRGIVSGTDAERNKGFVGIGSNGRVYFGNYILIGFWALSTKGLLLRYFARENRFSEVLRIESVRDKLKKEQKTVLSRP